MLVKGAPDQTKFYASKINLELTKGSYDVHIVVYVDLISSSPEFLGTVFV